METTDHSEQTGNGVQMTPLYPVTQDARLKAAPDTGGAVLPQIGGQDQLSGEARNRASSGPLALTKSQSAEPLTKEEQARLDQYERVIRHARDGMFKAALALKAIRDQRLYREEFDTFEEYCDVNWHLGRSSAYQRIAFAQTNLDLSATADRPTVTERVARTMGGLKPEDKRRVLEKAVHDAEGKLPTYRDVKRARIQLGLARSAKWKTKELVQDIETLRDSEATCSELETRWRTIRELLEEEFEAWPRESRVFFVKKLREVADQLEKANTNMEATS